MEKVKSWEKFVGQHMKMVPANKNDQESYNKFKSSDIVTVIKMHGLE